MATHNDVDFKFYAENKNAKSPGLVLLRDGEMVLEVNCEGDRPYTVVGKDKGGFFSGAHVGLVEDTNVQARWAKLDGDVYVGTWVEEGVEWLFTFELSPNV